MPKPKIGNGQFRNPRPFFRYTDKLDPLAKSTYQENLAKDVPEGFARCELCAAPVKVKKDGNLQSHRHRGYPCAGGTPSGVNLDMCETHGEYKAHGRSKNYACGCAVG